MSESDESNMPPYIGLARPLSEVSPQIPDWNAACEAMRWLNDIEAMQGGRNGPTIKLRSAIEALQAERDAAQAELAAVRGTLDMLVREAKRVADDCHRPRYTRLDEAIAAAVNKVREGK
jgi:hypothetical protein